MQRCPQCQASLSSDQYDEGICPACRTSQPDDRNSQAEAKHWSDVAKVPNLAEAGYLVSCLEHEHIEARLVHAESFSAATGAWDNDYLLQVPSECFADAREIVRQEADAIQSEQPEYDDFGEPIADEPVHLVIWRPVALMALAGLATLWLGQRVADVRGRNATPRSTEALTEAMAAIGQPLVVQSPNGQLRHRLTYQPKSRTWMLESDTDRDGRFDRQQLFRSTERP